MRATLAVWGSSSPHSRVGSCSRTMTIHCICISLLAVSQEKHSYTPRLFVRIRFLCEAAVHASLQRSTNQGIRLFMPWAKQPNPRPHFDFALCTCCCAWSCTAYCIDRYGQQEMPVQRKASLMRQPSFSCDVLCTRIQTLRAACAHFPSRIDHSGQPVLGWVS